MKKFIVFSFIVSLFLSPIAAANTFLNDIDGARFESEIQFLFDNSIVHGHPDGSYKPLDNLNRAEFIKIILEASHTGVDFGKYADDCFSDVKSTDWFSGYVCYAKQNEIVSGFHDGEFKPANSVHQWEAVKMSIEAFDKDFDLKTYGEGWYKPYFSYMDKNDLVYFIDPIIKNHCFYLNRGQMAKMVSQFL